MNLEMLSRDLGRVQMKASVPEFTDLSRTVWGWMGYEGLLVPWHDTGLDSWQREPLTKVLAKLKKVDVSLSDYAKLCLPLQEYTAWQRPGLLFCDNKHLSWIGKLRNYTESSENVGKVATFIETFCQLQIERFGKASLHNVVGVDPRAKTAKCLALYHQAWDRLRQFDVQGVEWRLWMRAKFEIVQTLMGAVALKTMVGVNGLEPNVEALKEAATDPWREVRSFLGLSAACAFPDGYIPKGWRPASDDFEKPEKIVRVQGDGFYYFADGSQRRGSRHYAQNKYFLIKAFPKNFMRFRDDWNEPGKVTQVPTWGEYSAYGAFPGMWDESGVGNGINNVRWRKDR